MIMPLSAVIPNVCQQALRHHQRSSSLHTHAYADDTQLYLSFKPDTTSSQSDALDAMERCVSTIRCWMIKDNFKVNDSKTEFKLIGTRQQLAKVDIKGLVFGDSTISPVTAVKNLGSWFDENMNMGCHINKMFKTLPFHLYNIRRIRKYLSKDSTRTFVHAFITARIDYCNGLLYGLPAAHLNKLQRIPNSAARIVCSLPRFCHQPARLLGEKPSEHHFCFWRGSWYVSVWSVTLQHLHPHQCFTYDQHAWGMHHHHF